MITALARVALLVAAGVGMAGCVATKYETIPYDTAKPVGVAHLPGCRDHPPKPNESCLALVRAGDLQTRTDVEVEPRQDWCIEVPEGQRWFDQSRVSSPLDGEPGEGVMNTVAGWKRIKDAPWFALVVGVATKAGKEADFKAVQQLPSAPDGRRCFRPSQPGTLVFYPNDAVPPAGSHSLFYGNNGGQIWVKLTRRQ